MAIVSPDLPLSRRPKSYYEQTRIARESLRASVAENLSPDYAEEIEAHFEHMPDHYFRATGVPEIIEHVKIVPVFSGERFQRERVSARSGSEMEDRARAGAHSYDVLHVGPRTAPGKNSGLSFRRAAEHFERGYFSARR